MELITVRVTAGLGVLFCVAVICDVPTVTPVAKPVFNPIVATGMVPEAHVALVVRI